MAIKETRIKMSRLSGADIGYFLNEASKTQKMFATE